MTQRFIIIIGVVLVMATIAYVAFVSPEFASRGAYRVLIINPPPPLKPALDGFSTEMAALGYEEGRNISFVFVDPGSTVEETITRVAPFLEPGDIDAVFSMGVLSTQAAKRATAQVAPRVPVVFGVVSNPVGGGLVESMQKPGGNVTGVTPANSIIASKRLEFFLQLVPGIERVVIAWNDPNTTGIEELRKGADTLGVELIERPVADIDELARVFETFEFQPGDGFFRAPDSVNARYVQSMIEMTLAKNVPLVGTNSGDTKRGALVSYGANYHDIGGQVARVIESVLKGRDPKDLPIQLPERFELSVNKTSAERLGITFPDAATVDINVFME